MAGSFLHNPVLVEATPENTTVEKIQQKVYRVDKKKKPQLIIQLIKEGNWQQVLGFYSDEIRSKQACRQNG